MLWRRVDELATAGVFTAIEAEAIAAYGRIVGLKLSPREALDQFVQTGHVSPVGLGAFVEPTRRGAFSGSQASSGVPTRPSPAPPAPLTALTAAPDAVGLATCA
jgi:hypothetical protein